MNISKYVIPLVVVGLSILTFGFVSKENDFFNRVENLSDKSPALVVDLLGPANAKVSATYRWPMWGPGEELYPKKIKPGSPYVIWRYIRGDKTLYVFFSASNNTPIKVIGTSILEGGRVY